jgi:hypothetical protein
MPLILLPILTLVASIWKLSLFGDMSYCMVFKYLDKLVGFDVVLWQQSTRQESRLIIKK